MLTQVLDIVHQQGWFDTGARYEKTVYLSRGASLSMTLTRGGVPQVFVKFSRLVSLEVEAARLAQACRLHPRFAPEMLGYHRAGDLHVIATRAADFSAVSIDMTAQAAAALRLKQALSRYFTDTSAAPVPASHAWADDLTRYFRSLAPNPAVEAALQQLQAALPSLPPLPQHGDLVLNNLGLRRDGGLVVFDWEDFGAVALPGLDLFTLEFSFQEGMLQARSPRRRTDAALDIDAWCRAQGLAPERHRSLRLCHALAFRYLKRSYGPQIQARLDLLIADAWSAASRTPTPRSPAAAPPPATAPRPAPDR